MASTQKTVILTGASQGIGAAVVRAFLERGCSGHLSQCDKVG
jgi:NAD(P)-dependent dehydrogenase (short-subunit alcohol dehydrogenase family)